MSLCFCCCKLVVDLVSHIVADLSSTSVSSDLCSNQQQAGVQELLWYSGSRRGCSVLPFQNVFVGPWISFPSAPSLIPVDHSKSATFIDQTNEVFLLIEAEPMPCVSTTAGDDDVLKVMHSFTDLKLP